MLSQEVVGGIPLVSVIGTPRTMGENLGSRLKPRLQVLAQYLMEQLAASAQASGRALTPKALRDSLRSCTLPASQLEPSLWMELESMAAAAELPIEDILLIHGYGDLLGRHAPQAPPARSAFLSLDATQVTSRRPTLVLAWHLDPTLLPYVTLLRRLPAHGPASLALTLAGLNPVAGISEADLAVAANELRVIDGTDGQFTGHEVAACLTAPSLDDARNRALTGPRQGGVAVHLLDGQGRRCSIEASGQTQTVLPDPLPRSPRVHTNHALTATVAATTPDGGDTSSRARLARLAARVVGGRDLTPDDIATWFGLAPSATPLDERARPPRQWTTPGASGGPDSTVVLIADPGGRSLHLRRGGMPARLEAIGL